MCSKYCGIYYIHIVYWDGKAVYSLLLALIIESQTPNRMTHKNRNYDDKTHNAAVAMATAMAIEPTVISRRFLLNSLSDRSISSFFMLST